MIETPQDRYKAYTKALIEASRIFEDAYDDLAESFKTREMKALLQASENLYDAATGTRDVLATLIANLKENNA